MATHYQFVINDEGRAIIDEIVEALTYMVPKDYEYEYYIQSIYEILYSHNLTYSALISTLRRIINLSQDITLVEQAADILHELQQFYQVSGSGRVILSDYARENSRKLNHLLHDAYVSGKYDHLIGDGLKSATNPVLDVIYYHVGKPTNEENTLRGTIHVISRLIKKLGSPKRNTKLSREEIDEVREKLEELKYIFHDDSALIVRRFLDDMAKKVSRNPPVRSQPMTRATSPVRSRPVTRAMSRYEDSGLVTPVRSRSPSLPVTRAMSRYEDSGLVTPVRSRSPSRPVTRAMSRYEDSGLVTPVRSLPVTRATSPVRSRSPSRPVTRATSPVRSRSPSRPVTRAMSRYEDSGLVTPVRSRYNLRPLAHRTQY
jgi:hypothetical protein